MAKRQADFIARQLEAMKAKEINLLPVSDHTSLMDYMVICEANSRRHAKSIAEKLGAEAKKQAFDLIGIEGTEESEWILIDLNYVVVHIMLSDVRAFYRLDDLWSRKGIADTTDAEV